MGVEGDSGYLLLGLSQELLQRVLELKDSWPADSFLAVQPNLYDLYFQEVQDHC